MSISNYQNPYYISIVTYKWRIPRINPEISKKAKNYLKKNKIPVEEFLNYVKLISMNEGALIRTYTGINVTEPIGVYVDYFEWDECVEFDECPKNHIIKDISIRVCFPNKTSDEIVDSIFKLNSLLYKAYPNLNAYFKLDHSCEWGDKK